MNILIINHYAGSVSHGMEYRPYYFGVELSKLGHQVDIIAASYSHVRAIQPRINKLVRNENVDGVNYSWYKTSSYKNNGIGRFINIILFLANVFIHTSKIIKSSNPDFVIASSTYPMDIWVAKRIARKSGAKLVFELHDMWPLSPIELGGMSKSHPFILLCQAAENYIYKHVDGVISILPKVHKYISSKGLCYDQLLISPNGFDPSLQQNENEKISNAEIIQYIREVKTRQKLLIVYTGSLGIPNAIDNLIDALKLPESKNFSGLIIGSGHEEDRLRRRIKNEGIENVRIFGPIPKLQIPDLLSYADCGYLGAPKQNLYSHGVSPNKIVDYMLARLPVFNATEAGNNIIDDCNAGYTIEPEDPMMLAYKLKAFYNLDNTKKKMMGENGRSYALANLSYNDLSLQLIKFLNKL